MTEVPIDKKTALVALVSDGTKLPALWDYTQVTNPNTYLHFVVSNKLSPRGFGFAKEKGIRCASVPWVKDEETRSDYSTKLAQTIRDTLSLDLETNLQNDYLVISAGQPFVLTEEFLNQFHPLRRINFHPGLLPDNPDSPDVILSNGESVPALRGIYDHNIFKETLNRGLKWAGITVHYLTDQVDAGSLILRGEVPVLENDTLETLANRVHSKEDEILPEALNKTLLRLKNGK